MRRVTALVVPVVLALGVAACGGSDDPAPPAPSPSPAASPSVAAATSAAPDLRRESVRVRVPAGLDAEPLDRARELTIPAGWTAAVFARVPKARFLLPLPDGRLLVSQPSANKVVVVGADGGTGDDFVTGLDRPHDLVLADVGGRRWLYVAATDQVVRYPYADGATRAGAPQVIVSDLPDDSLPELRGNYGHVLKNIAVSGDDLYVSIASTCNACVSDTRSDPLRGAIYRYSASRPDTGRALVARGIRNAEGLAFAPDGELWAVVNNRDNILVPSGPDAGQRLTSYVDNHPPELLIHVRQGAFFGWPFCNSNPDKGLRNMPYDRDYELNRDGAAADCAKATPVDVGIQAHSAPLGITFVPDLGAVVALHGSWNRSQRTGYKVVAFPWSAAGPGDQRDLVTGFQPPGTRPWGRPVDVAATPDGALLVSDDAAGAVYKLSPP